MSDRWRTGGNSLRASTARALNEALELSYPRRVWGRALEDLKDWKGRVSRTHSHKIMDTGDVFDANTDEYLGNLLDFLP